MIDADREYWRQLIQEWTHREEPSRDLDEWRAKLTDPRPGREYLMEQDERELLADSPDCIRVYRGAVRGLNERGLSWALTRLQASYWAHRNADLHEHGTPVVVVGVVARENVLALTEQRVEAEFIILPEDVAVVAVIDPYPDPRGKEPRETTRETWIEDADQPEGGA